MANLIILDEKSPKEITIKPNEEVIYEALNQGDVERIINLEEGAKLTFYELNLKEVNSNLKINLLGRGASVTVNTLSLAKDKVLNYNQEINHLAKETNSNVTNFAVALEKGEVNYKTVGKINRHMIKSNCKQVSRGIIIGDDASVKSEPILLIDEYDVFANHGCAIGKMSDEEMFYLMSRGLTKEEALNLIVRGLVLPFLQKLDKENSEKYNLEVSNMFNK